MSSVQEGFLCPMCMKDLGDALQLEVHFTETHKEESKASPFSMDTSLQSIKDKFKKKVDGGIRVLNPLLQKMSLEGEGPRGKPVETEEEEGDSPFHPVSGINQELWPEIQGVVKGDVFPEFSRHRSRRTDRFSTDTNKLIIRLEKLLAHLPSEPVKRRKYERDIVPWMDEDAVHRCPDCSKGFGVARRKHHCRLCGSVLCHDCSHSITFQLAQRLLNPATLSEYNLPDEEQKNGSRESLFSSSPEKKNNTQAFRACKYCADILHKRDSHVQGSAEEPPLIVQYYEHLKDLMKEAEGMSELYTNMVRSLRSGETEHRLQDAKFIRLKIMKSAESIDAVSKQILHYDNEKSPLQENVRSLALMFIKENLVCLEDVPSEADFTQLKQRRLEETSKRVQNEKTSALIAQMKVAARTQQKVQENNYSATRNALRLEEGFVLSPNSSSHLLPPDDDPILQQIHIIQSFITKAREAKRYDEVSTLEANLRDLNIEYKRTLAERKELEENYNSYKHIFKASPSSSDMLKDEKPPPAGSNPFDEDE